MTMALNKTLSIVLLISLLMLNGCSSASALHHRKDHAGLHHHHHHQVGGALAWTPGSNPQKWAAEHTLHVGDTIGFKYPKGQDSVLLVDRLAYHACDTSSPLASFHTGNDAITFKRKGHYFFISGVEHNCKFHGLKFNVRIPRGPHSAAALPQGPTPLFFVTISLVVLGIVLLFWSIFYFCKRTRQNSRSDLPV